jgi:hypothetical protein
MFLVNYYEKIIKKKYLNKKKSILINRTWSLKKTKQKDKSLISQCKNKTSANNTL